MPRDSYDAMRATEFPGMQSARQRKIADAKEIAALTAQLAKGESDEQFTHLGYRQVQHEPDEKRWGRVAKLKRKLGTRRAKIAKRAYYEWWEREQDERMTAADLDTERRPQFFTYLPGLGAAQNRYAQALQGYYAQAEAEEIDSKMLANAY